MEPPAFTRGAAWIARAPAGVDVGMDSHEAARGGGAVVWYQAQVPGISGLVRGGAVVWYLRAGCQAQVLHKKATR